MRDGIFIDHFIRQYGITATVTHLCDFVTHTQPNKDGKIAELVERQWVVVYEHADAQHGDQRIIVLPFTTEVSVKTLDTNDVLLTMVSRALEGTLPFEQYAERYFHFGRVGHNKIAVEAWAHPVNLYGDWHEAAGLYHRLRRWCSSPEMRADLDTIVIVDDEETRQSGWAPPYWLGDVDRDDETSEAP